MFYALVVLLVPAIFSAQLPSSFIKCNRKQPNFNQCLTKAIENAIHQLDKPIREVGLPSLEPLELPNKSSKPGTKTVGFQQNINNLKLSGFTKTKCSKAEFDFDKKKLSLDCVVPQFKADFDYDFNGTFLGVPLYGKGPGTIIEEGDKCLLTFDLKEFEEKGDKYYRVAKENLVRIRNRVVFNFKNLYGGDKSLGDKTLKLMNDNWEKVVADIGPNWDIIVGKIFSSIFDNVLKKVPIRELFGDG